MNLFNSFIFRIFFFSFLSYNPLPQLKIWECSRLLRFRPITSQHIPCRAVPCHTLSKNLGPTHSRPVSAHLRTVVLSFKECLRWFKTVLVCVHHHWSFRFIFLIAHLGICLVQGLFLLNFPFTSLRHFSSFRFVVSHPCGESPCYGRRVSADARERGRLDWWRGGGGGFCRTWFGFEKFIDLC